MTMCAEPMYMVFLTKKAVAEAVDTDHWRKRKVWMYLEMTGVDFQAFEETQYDILAAELRKHLDMKKIYEILEAGGTRYESRTGKCKTNGHREKKL